MFHLNKIFMKRSLLALALFGGLFFATGCDNDDDDELPNEEEVITSVSWTLTPVGGGDDVTLTFNDLDGEGGDDPIIPGNTLMANTTYNGSFVLLNETETPAENVTEEIEDEADEHQFFFSSTVNGVSVAYADTDLEGNPLGLENVVTTGDAGSGVIRAILRHEPFKDAPGVSDGIIDEAGGETDFDISFPVTVQ